MIATGKDQAARAAEREARKAFTPWDFRQSLRGMKLTLTQYRVAIELAEHAEVGKPAVWPSLATLAGNCACNQRMVEKSLADLTAMGIIAKGKGRSTRILLWALAAGALPGAGGLVILFATGARLGYRQAKAGFALRAAGIASFARPGAVSLGVVRSGSLVVIRPRALRGVRPGALSAECLLDKVA